MLVELNLARNVKGKKKRFYKYINSKRKTKENTAALLNGAAAPVTKDTEEPEVLNGISASVFTVKTGFKEYQVPETRGKFWSKALLSVEDQVREHLNRLNILKAMGPDGMPLQVLRELADVIARSLSIISERLWGLRESRRLEKSRHHSYLQEGGLGNYRLVSFTSVPGKVMKQLILDIISKHMKDKKMIRTSQHGFTKGKLCLTDLIAFYNEVTSLEGEEDVVYLDFSKTLTVSPVTSSDKLLKYELGKWIVRWIETWLINQAHRVVISGTKSSWRPVTSGVY
nr:uncharacterized protein LOC125180535 [Anser cygnoides]